MPSIKAIPDQPLIEPTRRAGPDRRRPDRSPFRYYERLDRVAGYIRVNLSHPISLTEAARVASLEPKYFSVYFKKRVGLCFRDWLFTLRIEQAKKLIASRDLSITDVASAVGFGSLRSFERNFKKQVGVAPAEHQKAIQTRLLTTIARNESPG